MNISDILKLKFPNASFFKDIILQDDGQGPYIREWNLSNPKPTSEDIQKWAKEVDLAYRQNQIRQVRASLYPSWEQQLDMQYHDIKDSTTIWRDSIDSIKRANPIPQE